MSSDLFSSNSSHSGQPLAYRMSPRTLDEYIGQKHIVGPGRLLRRVIQADRLSSIIFYGPPGTGKTSLARVIAQTTSSAFTSLNAVLSGVKELREAISEAQERRDLYSTRTILFIDEVHRWNKAQQDALLPWVENGTVVLIGATTQNPYFEVNSALVSRSRIFQLLLLDKKDLEMIVHQAVGDRDRGYGKYTVTFEPGALDHLIHVSAGDARSLLNALELAVETSPDDFPPPEGTKIHVSMDAAEQSIQQKAVLYDKEGDYHFDTISAFIKSIRGSDTDAAIYWLAKMIYAGEDPRFILRRMLISASEDIGMADPQALGIVGAAAQAFDRVGMPEGRHHLAQAAIYLATAPKSNSVLGFFDALTMVEQEKKSEIPAHLKDASRDSKGFGHGEGYLYPHAYRDHWVAQQYLPSSLQGRIFYKPSRQGYEASIETEVAHRRESQIAAALPDNNSEILTFSPVSKTRDRFLQRLLDNRSTSLSTIRESIFQKMKPARHDRICVVGAEDGALLWEALRQVPEGGVTGIVAESHPERAELLRHYARQLETIEQPEIWTGPLDQYLLQHPDRSGSFEFVIGRNYTTRSSRKDELFRHLHTLLSKDGRLILAEIIPSLSQRLSFTAGSALKMKRAAGSRIPPDKAMEEYFDILSRAEARLYSQALHPLLSWDAGDLVTHAEEAGFHDVHAELRTLDEERYIRFEDIDKWLNPGETTPTIGTFLAENEGPETIDAIKSWLRDLIGKTQAEWKSTVCFLSAVR